MRLGPPGSEIPAVLTAEGTHLDLRPLTGDIDGTFLAGPGLDRARAAVADGTLPALDATGLRVGPPVARPGAVLCIGMNYAAHAAETGAAPPAYPVLFYKAPNTVVGPDDTVLNPRGATKLDWEVELAVVIGTRVRYLESADQALHHVAGYAISNDVSERYFQAEISGGQWSKGKSCETFNPFGPWLVTADEIGDPQSLGLRTWVNGEVRQDSTTRDMVFGVAELIYQLSQVTVLEPGDILNTGTPQGVALSGRFPFLVPGDTVELEIDGLGRQRQLIAQA
jgi:2-keto-4-pentenoate hydratase/2-oxohepta-3-ene-1,7-dioic acid hydratase in catechol pathway